MKRKIIVLGLIISMLLLLFGTISNATVTVTNPTIESGGTVTINIKSSETVYAYKINVASAGGLTFSKATSTAGQVSGTTVNGASTTGVTSLATYTFTVPKVTSTTKYTITFQISVSTDGETYTDITKTSIVTVSAPANTNTNTNKNNNSSTTTTKSSDATLKSITVAGKSYTIGKTMTVSADTSSVVIKATTNNSKATVTGTGTKELVTGTNKFTLKVTAEDGTTKSYTVTIIREEYVEDNPNIIEPSSDEVQELRLVSLVVDGSELIPEFSSEIFEYSIYVTDINEVKIDAIANMEDANVEITGNTELIEGENTVIIKLTKDDKVVEYKININKSITMIQDEIEEEQKKVGIIGMINDWWNKSGPTTVIFSTILILLGAAIIFAIISYKYSKNARETSKRTRAEFIENNDIINKEQQ